MIARFVEHVIAADEAPEGKIIAFPTPAEAPTPDLSIFGQESVPPAVEKPMPPYHEYRETFRKLGFNAKNVSGRIVPVMYLLGIRSLEELARTPRDKLRGPGIGAKCLTTIRNVLAANGITPDWT
jgi:hypothetical protein